MSVLPPFAVIFGPTAGGKTEAVSSLHHELERRRGIAIELVSADSMQVYRGMDIGTAKPSPAERARFPHHLIDIRNPNEHFDVGAFVRLAEAAIRDAAARGAIPVVSGGTAFYIRAILAGLPETPPSDPEVRAHIEREIAAHGPAAVHEQLAAVDPSSAERIAPNDRYRIARALEVYRCTGRPRSSFDLPVTIRNELRVVCVGLARERTALYDAVNRRVDDMFRLGLRSEVEKLVAAGYRPGDPGLRAIGYREFFYDDAEEGAASRDARQAPALRADEEVIPRIKRNTRRYAKRQMTFFRRLDGVSWIESGDHASLYEHVSRISRC